MSIQNNNDSEIEAIFRHHLKNSQYLRPIESLMNLQRCKRIKHDPEYQRKYVWDKQKASFFIESILLGTEIPPLIFFKGGDDQVEVIDGRQRFETIVRFENNEFDLAHNGLELMKTLARMKYDNLSDSLLNSFRDTQLRIFEFSIVGSNQVDYAQEDLVKKEIFRRYNSGITPLLKHEVEKARYIDDPVTKHFYERLESDHDAYSNFVRIFSSTGKQRSLEMFDPNLFHQIMVRVRRLLVLHELPIRYYESTQGKEVASILYDRLSAQSSSDVHLNKIYCGFMSKVSIISNLLSTVSTKTQSRNRFLYEALYWSLSVLEKEGIGISRTAEPEFAQALDKHVRENANVYDSDRPTFRDHVIARFEKTKKFFIDYFCVNIDDQYIDNRDGISVVQFRKDETPNTGCQDFSNLRLNKTHPQSFNVEDVHNRMQRKSFLVRPDYQRYERITNVKASAIIESMILGIELPPIFVFERINNVTEVIDGQQRILSILGFMNLKYMDEKGQQVPSTKEGFKLSNLRLLKELNGKSYIDLDDQLKNKLLDFLLNLVTIKEKENPHFDPGDLYVRLNSKPYPIKDNTFEMWNSYIDRDTVQAIKEKTAKKERWFYLRIDNKRMENENLFTILAYLEYQNQRKTPIDDVLDFYARGGKISSRIKSKTNITKILESVSQDSTERKQFSGAIRSVESFIRKTRTLLIDKDLPCDVDDWLDEELTRLFFSKPRSSRSYNQFYVLWYVLVKINETMIKTHRNDLKPRIHQLMRFVRDTHAINEDQAVRLFYEVVESIREDHSPSERKLRLSKEQVSDGIRTQDNKCPLCGNSLFQGEDVEADHIIPIWLGGSDNLENIQIVHWICNREKGNALA